MKEMCFECNDMLRSMLNEINVYIYTNGNKNQGTTTITTDSNRNNTSPNEGMLKAKLLCEIKIMNSKSESTNTTNYIAKNIVVIVIQ